MALNIDDLIGSMQHNFAAGERGHELNEVRASLLHSLGPQAMGPPTSVGVQPRAYTTQMHHSAFSSSANRRSGSSTGGYGHGQGSTGRRAGANTSTNGSIAINGHGHLVSSAAVAAAAADSMAMSVSPAAATAAAPPSSLTSSSAYPMPVQLPVRQTGFSSSGAGGAGSPSSGGSGSASFWPAGSPMTISYEAQNGARSASMGSGGALMAGLLAYGNGGGGGAGSPSSCSHVSASSFGAGPPSSNGFVPAPANTPQQTPVECSSMLAQQMQVQRRFTGGERRFTGGERIDESSVADDAAAAAAGFALRSGDTDNHSPSHASAASGSYVVGGGVRAAGFVSSSHSPGGAHVNGSMTPIKHIVGGFSPPTLHGQAPM
ncbi:hypothetical protein K437DRAFT_268032 [Tilletiaria anomala UBC 951]|uniref:Uncharacterized protein n=1 Tax=Tilletiaria anomala (strain ATCC 24038 / CBS 436.72 / UBC 951) TaxID=1037660 RepID=A0A066VYK3_TILAU|nr:uncharacterized protein K437DRAFT_268032 [Tilletiaria anomala UBC 951]KDN46812.1 hypothetical protein K437DRAFT_268032 [Tilletiaria anomala UBC 951]